jgi:GT2 family glycosyltransferase
MSNSNNNTTNCKVTIVCLIYKSIGWLQFVYDQLLKYTDLSDKEFYFVANDATPQVLDYLKNNDIPHYIFNNTKEHRTHFYMNNVYRAYNFAVSKAKGEYVLLLNSDMAFSDGWLENLMEPMLNSNNTNICVCSRLVESGKYPSGKYGVTGRYGQHYKEYNENGFLEFAKSLSVDELNEGGLYGPLLIRKEHFDKVGGYPEGNIAAGTNIWKPEIPVKQSFNVECGDVVLMKKLKFIGVKHYTVFNSIIYHFQAGESQE